MQQLCEKEAMAEQFKTDVVSFKYADQYDKILMVEDVENNQDESFSNYEAYFRQYLAKDIAFKNFFKQRNVVLENIKYQILGII